MVISPQSATVTVCQGIAITFSARMRRKFPGSVCNTTFGARSRWIAGGGPASLLANAFSISAPVPATPPSILVKSLGSMAERSLSNVQIHEIDLMTDELPPGDYDFAWGRWVVSFVNDPSLLIQKLARVMPKGSLSIFHEYGHYETWRFFPRLAMQERFREHVIATWRESGGDPDGAARLPELLAGSGFVIRSARPHVFCLRPNDYMWQWPATFIEIYLPRLIEMGRIDQKFADKVRADLASAVSNRNALMLTPLVLEIIAEK